MAAAQRREKATQVSAPRVEPSRSSHGSGAPAAWRSLYSAHPRLMPTVYVPGPVVTARKV